MKTHLMLIEKQIINQIHLKESQTTWCILLSIKVNHNLITKSKSENNQVKNLNKKFRPEFAEATYYLYRATKNPFYLHVAKSIIENIYEITKVK